MADANERVRLEAKRRRVIENDEDLKNLRRAIAVAQTSKENHEQISQHVEKVAKERAEEKAIEQRDLEATD